MTISYTVSATAPFADLATGIDSLIGSAVTRSLAAKTIKEARFHEGEAAAYRHVANMLRNTTIRAEDIGEGLSNTIS